MPRPAEPAEHPNGATYIDHVVLLSPDLARTKAAIEALGVEPRGERDSDTYGAPMRQVFFRLGEVILELIGQPDAAGEGDPGFFGLAITVGDLDACRGVAGRPARQRQGCGAGGPAHRHAAPPRGGHERGHGADVAGAGLDEEVAAGPQDAAGGGGELGAAAPAGHGQHVTLGGGEGVERPLAAELAAAADGAVGEGHGSILRPVQ